DFLQIDPPINELVAETVFQTQSSAEAAIRAVYSELANPEGSFANGYTNSVAALAGMSSDELVYLGSAQNSGEFFDNNLTSQNTSIRGIWNSLYEIIYVANAVIDGLTTSPISETAKKRIDAEAKFVRAFCYFYLVNLFGDVPLLLDTDYRINSTAERT